MYGRSVLYMIKAANYGKSVCTHDKAQAKNTYNEIKICTNKTASMCLLISVYKFWGHL